MRLAKNLALALTLSFLASGVARGDITYSIVDYPTDHLGYSISGHITTDGSLGALTAANILSWEVVLADVTLSSSSVGASIDCSQLFATSSELLLESASPGHYSYLVLSTPPLQEDSGYVNWNRDPGSEGLFEVGREFIDRHSLAIPADEPWVLARVTAIPEPSSLAISGTSVALALSCWWGRRRRG